MYLHVLFKTMFTCFFYFAREKLVEEFFRNPTGPMVSIKVKFNSSFGTLFTRGSDEISR